RGGACRRAARRRRPALAGVRELRPVPGLRGARRALLRARRLAGFPSPPPKRARMARRRSAPAQQPLAQRILLTATLCLLAAGAVMVYSASSARTLLQGQGDGTGYLVKYVAYAAVGLVVMQVLARTGLDAVRRVTGPLLVAAFVLLLAVKVPHIGVEVNGARRWLGAGPLQFQPSELMKLALLLYAVRVIADKPKRLRSVRGVLNPLGVVIGAALLLVASQPDLRTAL